MFFSDFGDEEVEFLPMIPAMEEEEEDKTIYDDKIALLPLRNTVLFPGVVIPITVGRDKSIHAIKDAYAGKKLIGVVAQQNSKIEDPEPKDLHKVGTIAHIIRQLKMPDGNTTVIIQGKKRFEIKKILATEPYLKASINVLEDSKPVEDKEYLALIDSFSSP